MGIEALDLAVIAGFVTAIVGAITSVRLLGPNRKKIIIDAELASRKSAREEAEAVIGWYSRMLASADQRIVELERREDECEERNDKLDKRIAKLERVLRQNGLNGESA